MRVGVFVELMQMDRKSRDVGNLVGRSWVVLGRWMGMEYGQKKGEEKVGGEPSFCSWMRRSLVPLLIAGVNLVWKVRCPDWLED